MAKSFSEERPGQQLVEGLCDVCPEWTFVPGCVNRCACAVTAHAGAERESGAEGLLSHGSSNSSLVWINLFIVAA